MRRIGRILSFTLVLFMFAGCIFSPIRCARSCINNLFPKPDEIPKTSPEAEAAFQQLDDELFKWYVTSDITTLDQFCANPESFGINESEVPVTLGDFSETANDEWVSKCVEWKERLNRIDRSLLSDHTAFAYDTYCRFFDGEIESKDWFYNYEPLDEHVGLHMNLPLVFGLYMFNDEKDVQNYLTLLADVPRYMGQVLAFEQKRADLGLFMTENMLDQILEDLQSVANSGETSYLHDTFREAMDEVGFLSAEQKVTYIEQNDELIRTKWVEGYRLLYDGLSELRPKCREAVGAYEQGGSAYEYYCWKLRYEAAGNRTVDDEIKLLETCIDKMHQELMRCVLTCYEDLFSNKKITTGSLESDEEYLRTLMPSIVPTMPDVEVIYKEIPKELQDSFSPAAYLTPALDNYQHNIILTNPKDSESYEMSTLAHEGFPGHMYQFTYQYALGTIPKFQLVIETNGYAESWSTNSELNIARINHQFGEDLSVARLFNGTFTSDGFITMLLLMVCSLKVNGQGATMDELSEYLSEWGLDAVADTVYDLSVNMPIYYFKYAGGFSELFDLTNRCKKEVKNFDSVAFYREYLGWGPSYFDLLNEKMTAWAKAQ